jgi:uncharacterized protein (UPF0262 family)
MLTHISSQTILRAVFQYMYHIQRKKWQGILAYQMKKEAVDMRRIGLTLI